MKIIGKFADIRHGWRGLRAVWREEWHFKYQVGFVVAGMAFACAIGASAFELVLLAGALSVALASEIINTAVEDVCNKIEPNFDPAIGAIKDMAQAFVIVSSMPAIILLFYIIAIHL